MKRATTGNPGRDTGLFGGTGSSAVLAFLGLPNAHVTSASESEGALAGRKGGRIATSWAGFGAISHTRSGECR